MLDSKIPRIREEKIVNDKVWQIISFFEDGKERFDIVCFYKVHANRMANEYISSKERIETFENIKEAKEFLEKLEK